eukprot:6196170-Pleurochrysis_carterae.AAC.7
MSLDVAMMRQVRWLTSGAGLASWYVIVRRHAVARLFDEMLVLATARRPYRILTLETQWLQLALAPFDMIGTFEKRLALSHTINAGTYELL